MRTKWKLDLGKGWIDNFITENFVYKSGYTLSYRFISDFLNNQHVERDDLQSLLEDLRELSESYKQP